MRTSRRQNPVYRKQKGTTVGPREGFVYLKDFATTPNFDALFHPLGEVSAATVVVHCVGSLF